MFTSRKINPGTKSGAEIQSFIGVSFIFRKGLDPMNVALHSCLSRMTHSGKPQKVFSNISCFLHLTHRRNILRLKLDCCFPKKADFTGITTVPSIREQHDLSLTGNLLVNRGRLCTLVAVPQQTFTHLLIEKGHGLTKLKVGV